MSAERATPTPKEMTLGDLAQVIEARLQLIRRLQQSNKNVLNAVDAAAMRSDDLPLYDATTGVGRAFLSGESLVAAVARHPDQARRPLKDILGAESKTSFQELALLPGEVISLPLLSEPQTTEPALTTKAAKKRRGVPEDERAFLRQYPAVETLLNLDEKGQITISVLSLLFVRTDEQEAKPSLSYQAANILWKNWLKQNPERKRDRVDGSRKVMSRPDALLFLRFAAERLEARKRAKYCLRRDNPGIEELSSSAVKKKRFPRPLLKV